LCLEKAKQDIRLLDGLSLSYKTWDDLPYPNDLLQEVDRWVAKCICCNLQFVNALTYSISYADADMYPNIHGTLHRNLPLCLEKAKQDIRLLDGLSLSYKTWADHQN
jgi:hypothetical protein